MRTYTARRKQITCDVTEKSAYKVGRGGSHRHFLRSPSPQAFRGVGRAFRLLETLRYPQFLALLRSPPKPATMLIVPPRHPHPVVPIEGLRGSRPVFLSRLPCETPAPAACRTCHVCVRGCVGARKVCNENGLRTPFILDVDANPIFRFVFGSSFKTASTKHFFFVFFLSS